MKIQYMSDLHFEFRENSRYIKHNEFPVTGDILVLAGDIFYLKDKVSPLSRFWKWASENYRQVLIIPGNHEYYNYCDVMERITMAMDVQRECRLLSKSGIENRRYRFHNEHTLVAYRTGRRIFRLERT